jgi:ketosteroid isomerase-like protein
MTESNIKRVQTIYTAFGAGDTNAVLSVLDPAVVWSNAGPADVDYFGTRRCRDEVAEVFAILDRDFAIEDFTPLAFFANGDDVAVLLRLRATMKPTGRTFEEELVHVWTFGTDGLVKRMRDIQDSAGVAAALRP